MRHYPAGRGFLLHRWMAGFTSFIHRRIRARGQKPGRPVLTGPPPQNGRVSGGAKSTQRFLAAPAYQPAPLVPGVCLHPVRRLPWRPGNLLITFCPSGFWYSASWNFLIWGIVGLILRRCHHPHLMAHVPGNQSWNAGAASFPESNGRFPHSQSKQFSTGFFCFGCFRFCRSGV